MSHGRISSGNSPPPLTISTSALSSPMPALEIPASSLGRDDDRHRGRTQAPGRAHRHHLGASHLGLGDDAPSACAHDRAGRRHLGRRITMGLVQTELYIVAEKLARSGKYP